jgi:hypothetical protein
MEAALVVFGLCIFVTGVIFFFAGEFLVGAILLGFALFSLTMLVVSDQLVEAYNLKNRKIPR